MITRVEFNEIFIELSREKYIRPPSDKKLDEYWDDLNFNYRDSDKASMKIIIEKYIDFMLELNRIDKRRAMGGNVSRGLH